LGIRRAFIDRVCCRKIIATREESKCELRALGMQFTDSQANFLLARHPDISGENLYQELKNRGILVRYFGEERIRDWVRISIGTAEQMSALFREIKAILKKEEAR
ncbi:MAG: aminotransferase class I/II-fold pyridoxal phosphate-dependent enzyme, partial [Bacillota bacterium]|nr:aminotransferase class I/II-fold pyridoxal phosphate-dependent enzyme [Bacillota bacterium]